jgi:hypothetical protein
MRVKRSPDIKNNSQAQQTPNRQSRLESMGSTEDISQDLETGSLGKVKEIFNRKME